MSIFSKKSSVPRRRNRPTDQPVTNRTTFSYYQNRVIPEKDQVLSGQGQAKAKLKKRIQYLPTFLAVVAIIVSLVYIMSVQPNARIIVVNDQNKVTRSFLRPETTYANSANKWLTGSPLNYSKLTINNDKLAQDLQKQFPELAHVSVSLPIVGRRPLVYLQVTQPAYTYTSNTGEAYVIDEQGRAMMSADDSLAPSLTVIKDDASQDAKLGDQLLPGNEIDFMQTVQKQFAAKGLRVEEFVLPPRANELLVNIKGLKYQAKLSFVGDAREQSGAFLAVKKSLDKAHKTASQYIDVRVEGRAYYK